MWTHKFDFTKRHCWPDKDGVRWIEHEFTECENWQEHPYQSGQSEYLRWIRQFGALVPGIVTGFVDGFLKLGPDIMFSGKSCYCENYGGIVKGFLNINEGWAIVEITDPNLYSAAEEAVGIVNLTYK